MADFYYKLVKAGKLSIEKVPTKYKAKVQALLNEDTTDTESDTNE